MVFFRKDPRVFGRGLVAAWGNPRRAACRAHVPSGAQIRAAREGIIQALGIDADEASVGPGGAPGAPGDVKQGLVKVQSY